MLKQRILTALVLVPVLFVIVLWLPSTVTLALFAALVLMGAWEWSAFLTQRRSLRGVYVAVIAGFMMGAWAISSDPKVLEILLAAASIWWVAAFVWVLCFPARVVKPAAAIAGVLVLVPAWVALARLHEVDEYGPRLTLFLLVLVWTADVGAYFTGRRIGSLKLAPRVSPGKTWEGVGGGFVAGAGVAVLGALLFKVPLLPFVMLCMAVVLISVVGDLTESLFKRYAGLKDSGSVFPGHGGVLDRIDSVTAAAPFFVLGVGWLGLMR